MSSVLSLYDFVSGLLKSASCLPVLHCVTLTKDFSFDGCPQLDCIVEGLRWEGVKGQDNLFS